MKIATIASLVASTLATASFFPSKAEADARICKSGLSWHPIEKGDKQAKVTAVDTGSSAQTVGFRPGDIILTIAGQTFCCRGQLG